MLLLCQGEEDMSTPWSDGPLDADICVIGEAPAIQEMIRQRPFVGESGSALDACLHQAGLLRHNIRLENVIREKIRNTDPYLGKHGLTTKGREAAEDLKGRLLEGNYKVLVPLGNLALAAVTGMKGITRYRGPPLPCTLIDGMRVIPTIHPAATLIGRGKYLWIYDIVADLRKAKRHAANLDCLPKRNLIIDPTHAECLAFLHDLYYEPRFGFDIEVYNYQVS